MAFGLLGAPAYGAPPANDDLAAATTLSSDPSVVAGSTAEATREPGEAGHNDSSAGASVWYRWTPAGATRLSTCDSDFDTVLAVYTGSSEAPPAHAELSKVADNDDGGPLCGGGDEASLELPALAAGQAYYIAVDGHRQGEGAASGNFELHAGGPANDAFADRETIAAPATIHSATNDGADLETGEPANVTGSVWYSWTAPGSGPVRITTCGSAFDTKLGVYTGTSPGTLTQVGTYALDACDTGDTVVVQGGSTYAIQVGGAGMAGGSFVLRLNSPANDDFAAAAPLTGLDAVATGTNVAAGRETGEPGGDDASVWYSWTAPPGAGQSIVSTCSSGFDTVLGIYTGTEVGALTPVVAPVDDTAGCGVAGTRSRVQFDATPGTTYTFVVWGKGTGALTAQGAVAISLDGAAPETTLTSVPPDVTNDSTPTFAFASEPGADFECKVDAGSFAGCSSPFTIAPALGDGPHTFEVRAVDASGNADPSPAVDSFTLDTVAPGVDLGSQPLALSNDVTPTVTFSSPDGTATFTCAVDAGAFGPCSGAGMHEPTLGHGTHTISVRATDPAGNTSTAVTATFTIDTVAPPVTLVSGVPAFTSDPTPEVAFTSEGGTQSGFRCKVDDGAFADCASPFTTDTLGTGLHKITVKARDAAGNETSDAADLEIAFTVDTTPPDTTITGKPSDPSNLTFPDFAYTQTDTNPGTFQCRVDSAPAGFTACLNPEAQGLGNGLHRFEVRAVDAAGNVDPTPAVYEWTVDISAPTTTITAPAAGAFLATQSPTAAFSSTEPGTFECAMDAPSGFAPCTTGSVVAGAPLTQGAHTLHVRSIDAAGNISPVVTRTFTVDSIAPETAISTGPDEGAITKASTATFTFAATDANPDVFECRLDAAPTFTTCSSPSSFTGLADGEHTLRVRARDKAGTADASETVRTWTVDTTPPSVNIVDLPAQTGDTTPTVEFSSPDGGISFECRVDVGPIVACSSPFTVPAPLDDGGHTIFVRALDAATNEGPFDSTTFTIDTTAPETTLGSGPTGSLSVVEVTQAFSSADPTATFECSLDAGAFEACTSPATFGSAGSPLSEGDHTIEVRAKDPGGNTDATPATTTFNIDRTAPNAEIVTRPDQPSNVAKPLFTFVGNDVPGTVFRCKVDAGAYAPCTSPFTATGPSNANLADGSHTVSIYAIDPAGNDDLSSPAEYTWTVDRTMPQSSITSGPSGVVSTSSVTFGFTANEPASFDCSLNPGPTFSVCSGTQGYTIPAAPAGDGQYTFSVRASDGAGNTESPAKTRTFTVDRTAPQTFIGTKPPSNAASSAAVFTFSMTDTHPSSVFECKLDAAPSFTACPTAPAGQPIYTGLAEGQHTLEVRAKDAAVPANADASPAVYTWNVDTVEPNTSIATTFPGPSNTTDDSTPAVSFSSNEAGATFQCKMVTDASYAPCVPGQDFGPFAQGGPYTLQVRARDTAGNFDRTPAEIVFNVDSVAPVVTINVPSANFATPNATPVFSGTGGTAGNDATNVTVRVWAHNPDPPVCPAGQVCPGTPLHTFTPSLTGPGGAWSVSMPALAEGVYTLQVAQTDGLNTTHTAPRAFRIDTTPPVVSSLTKIAPTTSPVASVTDWNFSWPNPAEHSAQFPVTYQCRFNSNAFGPCAQPQLGNAVEGTNQFKVRAIDAAGNIGPEAVSEAWVVDLTGPAIANVAFDVGAGNTNRSAVTISAYTNTEAGPSGTGNDFTCAIVADNVPPARTSSLWTSCDPGPKTYNLPEGRQTVAVRAHDALGNPGTPVSRTFFVDRSSPTLNITGGPSGLVNSAIASFTWTAQDATQVTFKCSIDNGPLSDCTSPKQYTGLAEGNHSFRLEAKDAVPSDANHPDAARRAGNPATVATRTFRVDTTTPETAILEGPAGTTPSRDASFLFATNEPGSAFECKLDGAPFAACPDRMNFAGLPLGTHTVQVRARDTANNVDTTPASRTWTIEDLPPPVVVPPSPPSPPPPPPPPVDEQAQRLAEQRESAKRALGEEAMLINLAALPASAAAFHGLSAKDNVIDVKGSTTKMLVLFCDSCTVRVVPTLRLDRISKRVRISANRRVALPSQSAKLAAGQPLTVRLRLTSRERAAIPKARKARVTLAVTLTDRAGKKTTVTKTYTLRVVKKTTKKRRR